jgi:hypothetical protein
VIDVKGIVPVWAAWEEVDRDERRVERSWFKEVDPPYRRGVGYRIRLGSRALHFGVMRHTRARSELDVVGREVAATVDDIADWRSPSQPRSSP